MRLTTTIAAFFLVAAPAIANDQSGATHAELMAFNDRFNDYAASYDIDGMMSLYDQDTLWIAPTARPAEGRDGVPRETFTFLSENKGTLTHTVDKLIISNDGTQAVMIGEADVLVENAGLDVTGTYLFVLERDGEAWEIVVDMFNNYAEK